MHLLRRTFETAKDYAQAKEMLARTPIARPAIFTLVGVNPGETCIIERTEKDAHIHGGVGSAANHWRYGKFAGNWNGRGDDSSDLRGDSEQRSSEIERFSEKETGDFAWVVPPVLNPLTRLAIEMIPSSGQLRARAYEYDEAADQAAPCSRLHETRWT